MQIEYEFFNKLKLEKRLPKSLLGAVVKNSKLYKLLIQAQAIDFEKVGRGSNVFIKNQELFDKIYNQIIDNSIGEISSKSDAAKKFGSSKSVSNLKNNSFYFYRGNKNVVIDNENIDLNYYTDKFGFFGCSNKLIETPKLCWIENKDCFEMAEKIIGNDYVFVHKYGRLGKNDFTNWNVNEILFCPDYDFKGLEEYLVCKENFDNTMLYIPDNFEGKLLTSKMPIKGAMQERLKRTTDKQVMKIRDFILKNSRFLEQQFLF